VIVAFRPWLSSSPATAAAPPSARNRVASHRVHLRRSHAQSATSLRYRYCGAQARAAAGAITTSLGAVIDLAYALQRRLLAARSSLNPLPSCPYRPDAHASSGRCGGSRGSRVVFEIAKASPFSRPLSTWRSPQPSARRADLLLGKRVVAAIVPAFLGRRVY